MRLNHDNPMRVRRVSNECAQCGSLIIAPVWSEHLNVRSIRHLWNCDACGYSYETTVYFAPRADAQNITEAAA